MVRVLHAWLLLFVLVACTSAPPPTLPATIPPSGSSQPTGPIPDTAAPTQTAPTTESPTASPSPSGPALELELSTPGVLSVCLAMVGAPAASIGEDGQPQGYNASMGREIGDRLGLTVEFEQPLFEELIQSVEQHACDISVSSQNITDSRLERVAMIPYTESQQPIVVQLGNPENIDSLETLCGLDVSAVAGTTHTEYMGEICDTAGLPDVELSTFDTEEAAAQALLDGDVVAYIGNPNFVALYPDHLQYAYVSLPQARQGITVALDRPGLQQAIAETLDEMIADGTYRQILVDHLPNDLSVRIVSILE